jgi:hypothetical protein
MEDDPKQIWAIPATSHLAFSCEEQSGIVGYPVRKVDTPISL